MPADYTGHSPIIHFLTCYRGHAKDYIKAMYLTLEQDQPCDYVIATGITTTIRDFITLACAGGGGYLIS